MNKLNRRILFALVIFPAVPLLKLHGGPEKNRKFIAAFDQCDSSNNYNSNDSFDELHEDTEQCENQNNCNSNGQGSDFFSTPKKVQPNAYERLNSENSVRAARKRKFEELTSDDAEKNDDCHNRRQLYSNFEVNNIRPAKEVIAQLKTVNPENYRLFMDDSRPEVLVKIKVLNLEKNKLWGCKLAKFAYRLEHYTQIETINLQINQLNWWEADEWAAFLKAQSKVKSLKKLLISPSELTPETVQMLKHYNFRPVVGKPWIWLRLNNLQAECRDFIEKNIEDFSSFFELEDEEEAQQ